MLSIIAEEHRSLASKRPGIVDSVPSDTLPHIVEHLRKCTAALFEKRALPEAEHRHYQTLAQAMSARRRPVSDQTDVLAQIARFNARKGNKRQSIVDARALAAKYPELDFETVSRAVRLDYSEDTMNDLRLAAIARQMRAGYTGADFSMPSSGCSNTGARFEPGGQVADPSQSLRDDFGDSDFWKKDDDEDWDSERHLRCCQYHRNRAQQSASMSGVSEHLQAADLHVKASYGAGVNDSRAARLASRKLTLADIS